MFIAVNEKRGAEKSCPVRGKCIGNLCKLLAVKMKPSSRLLLSSALLVAMCNVAVGLSESQGLVDYILDPSFSRTESDDLYNVYFKLIF